MNALKTKWARRNSMRTLALLLHRNTNHWQCREGSLEAAIPLQHPCDTSFAAQLAVDPYGVRAATYPPLLTYARGYGGGACPDIHGHYLQVSGNATPERGTAGWRQHRTRAESPHTGEEDGLPAQGSHADKRTR